MNDVSFPPDIRNGATVFLVPHDFCLFVLIVYALMEISNDTDKSESVQMSRSKNHFVCVFI